MSSIDAMGPGTPTPISYGSRQIGKGKPLTYSAKADEVQADVAHAQQGVNLNAQFQPRPPVRAPGIEGIGQTGSHIDTQA
jgi:hypothetical protein